MAQIPNPPQFEEDYDVYKMRQFVEEMIRTLRALNDDVAAASSGGTTRGYPPQLGHARI